MARHGLACIDNLWLQTAVKSVSWPPPSKKSHGTGPSCIGLTYSTDIMSAYEPSQHQTPLPAPPDRMDAFDSDHCVRTLVRVD